MMARKHNMQMKLHLITIENLLPEDHFLRKSDRLVDFTFIYEDLGLTIKTAGAGSAYATILICQVLEDMGISPYTPRTTGGMNYKVEFTRKDFEYQKETDCFIYPGGKRLALRSLEREEFNICRVYRAERKDCGACPMSSQCVPAKGVGPSV